MVNLVHFLFKVYQHLLGEITTHWPIITCSFLKFNIEVNNDPFLLKVVNEVNNDLEVVIEVNHNPALVASGYIYTYMLHNVRLCR